MLALDQTRPCAPVFLTPPALRTSDQAVEVLGVAGELVGAAVVLMDRARAAAAGGDRRRAFADLILALELVRAAKRLRRLSAFWRR